MSGKPYIGCKIGLLSKAQNRYEGILYTIDTVNSTVVLAKVKCFGTEGRPTDRPTPPKDVIYEYITFRGNDIKDITLCEPPRSYHDLPYDPAIVQSSVGPSPQLYSSHGPFSPLRMPSYNQLAASSLLNQQYAAAMGLGPVLQGPPVRRGPMVEKAVQTIQVENPWQNRGLTLSQDQQWEGRRPQGTRRGGFLSRRGTAPRKTKSAQPVASAQQRTSQEHDGNDENRSSPRRRQGARRRSNRSRGRLMVASTTTSTLKFETDFDFDSSNAQFLKEELEREMQGRLVVKETNSEVEDKEHTEKNIEGGIFGPKCYYDKAKSFFDNISSDNKPRLTWAEERKRNLETFGVTGRFLRGRGFRGGYRGRRGWGTPQGLP